jgi:hypothetical protein
MFHSIDEFTIMKAKCTTECILGLIDCLKIKKDQTGLDDDWKVSFILTICCGWTQVKWRTKLLHNSDSSWLERVLDTQAQGGGTVGSTREANCNPNIMNGICLTLTGDC